MHASFATINPAFLPKTYSADEAKLRIGRIEATQSSAYDPALTQLLEAICGASPYLSKLMADEPDTLRACFTDGIDETFNTLTSHFGSLPISEDEVEIMKQLRLFKNRAALLIAVADISGLWDLKRVTQALSLTAQITLQHSLDYLLAHYQQKQGLKVLDPENHGIFVLAMGKLGAQELNYSSDVDLILLYDATNLEYSGRHSLQQCLNRLAQDYIRLMQDRTPQGYVFRMDIRLRPDPSSTPLMVNTEAALRYYESVGQNWERAAFIKARPIAGDKQAAAAFLAYLKPFIWRKSLDYAAIADIQSIKRQIQRKHYDLTEMAGYDLKKGIGGIREIEFLCQTHQLIWGGRQRELRQKETLKTLDSLGLTELLTHEEVETLTLNYQNLRTIEHRLQMLHDEQTHQVPKDDEMRERLAIFCGYQTVEEFETHLRAMAMATHVIYQNCFDDSSSLAGDGKLSFTGVSHDDETLQTLTKMGFNDALHVSETIRKWHHGSIRAMQSTKARQLLTELTPSLLQEIAHAHNADHSFKQFERFFNALPSGVMLLSLLTNNLQLLKIIITVISSAPILSEKLAKHPDWLDAIVYLGRDEGLPKATAHNPPESYKQRSYEPEFAAQWLCRYRAENEFVLGCQILANAVDPLSITPALTHLADNAIELLTQHVATEFAKDYGTIPNSQFAVVALGRLGSRELTFSSDLDLLFLYDCTDNQAQSNGRKSLSPSVYYNRLAQRIVGQLTAMTPEGRLYDVDIRLRPAGNDGPLAVSLNALKKYYAERAWTYEFMALMRHRVITLQPENHAGSHFEDEIKQTLIDFPHHPNLTQDVLHMRQRVAQEYYETSCWKVKHVRGGLMDITFIAQYLALKHQQQSPQLMQIHPMDILHEAQKCELINALQLETLNLAWNRQNRVQAVMRLCHKSFDETQASPIISDIIAKLLKVATIFEAKAKLEQSQQEAYRIFTHIIGKYDKLEETK